MKLYNIDHSPYASRVRMAIRKKALSVSIEPPPVPLRTDEFKALFPLGKLPVLALDDGSHIPDSWVILEYLEDCFTDTPLRPSSPLARAQMQMLARYADTYLGPGALFPLFANMLQPGGLDNAEQKLAPLAVELQRLERLLAELPACEGRDLHIGDMALSTTLAFVLIVAPRFGLSEPLGPYPNIQQWWQWVQSDVAVATTLDEMAAAFELFMKSLGGS